MVNEAAEVSKGSKITNEDFRDDRIIKMRKNFEEIGL